MMKISCTRLLPGGFYWVWEILVWMLKLVFRIFFTGFTYQARLHSFRVFQKALEKKSGGANVKYAWYGATKDEVYKILSHGFGHFSKGDETQVSYGTGVYFSPLYAPLESVQSAVEGKDGLGIFCFVKFY